MKSFIGHVDENGKLSLDQLPDLPPGADLAVLIMSGADIEAVKWLIDSVAQIEEIDPALLEKLEALDEALWDMQFAASKEALAELAEQALSEHEQGKTVELDLDELNRKDT